MCLTLIASFFLPSHLSFMYITKYSCVFLKLSESTLCIYVAMDLIPILLGSLPLAHNAQHSLVIMRRASFDLVPNSAPEEVRQAPAHVPCGPSFNCMFDIPRRVYCMSHMTPYAYVNYTVKNVRSFQPFLGYLSCFYSCFYNSSHSPYHYTQLILYKHPPVWFPASSMYKRICKSETMGLGKYNTTSAVHYFGTGPKAELYNTLARALECHYPCTFHTPELQDRFLILISFHGS